MDEIVWVVNPRNDTLENLATYLSHYAVEYFQNTSIECELRLPQEIPHYPLSSETRHNLFLTFEEALNNVLKHSAATKVKVEMTISALEFELKITDNGKGFEVPDLRRRISEPGARWPRRQRIEKHAPAADGHRRRMPDRQPARRRHHGHHAHSVEPETAARTMKKIITVSIVDDEADLREHIAGYLAATGNIRCKSAYASAEEALEHLPQDKPDVILMDINLGDMDGIECVRRLTASHARGASADAHSF